MAGLQDSIPNTNPAFITRAKMNDLKKPFTNVNV